MSSGPPLGQPWCANIGNNPNINRDGPPPPFNAIQDPPSAVAAPNQAVHQVIQEHHQPPIYSPPVPIGIGGGLVPPFGFAPPFSVGVGLGMLPPPMGMGDPFMYGGGGGSLAPIRSGNFLPGAHGGIGFGLHAGGMPFPPPPPGALAGGVVPAFAPAAPLWAPGGGLAVGNVPVVAAGAMPGMMTMMGGVGVGVGAGGGLYPHDRPGPMFIDGNGGPPPQPDQTDVTQIPGGVAPGITLVESAEHTIIVQIKGNICPWLSPGARFQVERFQMASTTGLNRLIQVCNNGASADDCENMAVTECIELGNGLWEKGQTFKYNDAVARVLTMKDAGWDNKRNRQGGQSLHLWLHRI